MIESDNTLISRESLERTLENFRNYYKKYYNYPGSPGDDALLGIYGYTVRDERGYIRRSISKYKKALEWMDKNGKNSITARELFYL